jgi:HK97 family phage portal protein
MAVDRAKNGKLLYTYQSDKGEVKLQREDILHVPGLGFDGLIGYSPIAMMKNTIGVAIAVEEFGATFFSNGANPGGVLEHPGTVKDIPRVKESWNASYQGSGNAHKIGLLEEGMKFHQISIPPEQAQFLQTRKFQLNEIARLFRIPPHMIGDLEKSSFSNIEQQSLEFVKYSLDPWVVRWEQSLQQCLFLPSEKRDYFIRFNVDGLLRGDYGSRMTGYSSGIQNGWLSPNDVRSLEDMNKIPAEEGGDNYMVNGNMVKLKDAGAGYKKVEKEE